MIGRVNADNGINHSVELAVPLVDVDVAGTVQEIGFGEVEPIK